MPWIESHTVLIRHPKLRGLAREARLRPAYAMGHLHALWHAALEQREDGDLSSWSDEAIADLSDYPGDGPQWVRLLQKYGWLDDKRIHDWLDYAGRYLKTRYASKNPERLKAIWAVHGRPFGEVVEGLNLSKTLPAPPNLTQPDQTKEQQRLPSGPGRPGGPVKVKAEMSPGFLRFWGLYPRKDCKAPAWASWQRLKVTPELEAVILTAVTREAASDQWTKEDGKWIPLPTTWLNQRRWENEGTRVVGGRGPMRPAAPEGKYANVEEVV